MTLNTISTTKQEILSQEHKRLDVKFYVLKIIFNLLEKKSSYEVRTLEELEVQISSGSYIDQYVCKSEGVPYIRVGNIKPFSIDEQERGCVFVSRNVHPKIKVKENDIILGRTQATVEKLGVASIVDKTIDGFVISQHVSKLTVNPEKISPFYLIGYLNSKFYKAQTSLATHGDTRVEMTHSQLKKVKCFLPEENVLSSIELKVKKIVELNRLAIKKIEESKELLRTKLNISSKSPEKYFSVSLSSIQAFGIWNARSHLPKYVNVESELNANFTTVELGIIADPKRGVEVGSDNYLTDMFRNDNDYAFIRTSDITNNEIDIYPDYFVDKDSEKCVRNKAVCGDIVFSKDGIIGETAIISKYDNVVLSSGLAQIKLKPEAKKYNISPEYLFTILINEETGYFPALRRTVIASTIPHLREDRLKEIRIPVLDKPSIDRLTELIKEAFVLKDNKKRLIIEVIEELDSYYNTILNG